MAAAMSRNCAEAMARLREARWSFGPRPSVGAGACVTSAPGSTTASEPGCGVLPSSSR